jgi:hypothetical protein
MNSTFIIPVVEMKTGGIEEPLYSADRTIEPQEMLEQDEIRTLSPRNSVLKSEKVSVMARASLGFMTQEQYSLLA